MHASSDGDTTSEGQLPSRVLWTLLIWFAVGGILGGSVLLFQAIRDHHAQMSLQLGALAVCALGGLLLVRRRLGYRRTAWLSLVTLLSLCTYIQCFHGPTPGTVLGSVAFLLLCGMFFGASGVRWGFGLSLLSLLLSAAPMVYGWATPWHNSLWDARDSLVWVRYGIVLFCFGGAVAAALVLLIGGLQATTEQLSETLASERRERVRREAVQRALDKTQRIEALGQLAAGMAHDFNNSLMVIMSAADEIRARSDVPVEVTALAAEIAERTEVGAETIRQLLSLGRDDRGRPSHVALEALVQRSLSTLRHAAADGVSIELSGQSQAQIWIDAARFQQALLNLALNARDAMPAGGTWRLRLGEQEIAQVPPGWSAEPGRFACLECSDTGVGLDAMLLDKIFEPFFTTKGEGKGTGLGLTMVHKTIGDARGFIEVESRPGSGTTFRLYLPVREPMSASGFPPPSAAA